MNNQIETNLTDYSLYRGSVKKFDLRTSQKNHVVFTLKELLQLNTVCTRLTFYSMNILRALFGNHFQIAQNRYIVCRCIK